MWDIYEIYGMACFFCCMSAFAGEGNVVMLRPVYGRQLLLRPKETGRRLLERLREDRAIFRAMYGGRSEIIRTCQSTVTRSLQQDVPTISADVPPHTVTCTAVRGMFFVVVVSSSRCALLSFLLQDLLRPFLLACNHSDASPRLMIMAMGSMQYLINRDAILPSDAPNILRFASSNIQQ